MKKLSTEEINLLRQNARSVVRELGLLNDAYFEIGVTLAERHLLIELSCCPETTAKEIAQRLLLDKSTVSRLIAKAAKKGYIKCTADKQDKRKRTIQLTEKGKKTLHAFEPIAFNQTKQALETLTPEEVDCVYQGVSLYAQGLKNARLGTRSPEKEKESVHIESLQEINEQLETLGYILRPIRPEDKEGLYAIFKEVVDTGSQFPYECSSREEFNRQFLSLLPHVYVCCSSTNEVIGGFYIRANFSGRSAHIANAAYMIKETLRSKGIGSLLVKASLHIAKNLGFRAMQFNMVLSQNKTALNLYKKLGFNITGTIPAAVRNPDGSYQDGHIMHRKL